MLLWVRRLTTADRHRRLSSLRLASTARTRSWRNSTEHTRNAYITNVHYYHGKLIHTSSFQQRFQDIWDGYCEIARATEFVFKNANANLSRNKDNEREETEEKILRTNVNNRPKSHNKTQLFECCMHFQWARVNGKVSVKSRLAL